ncbi:unnamed protein product [Boreogadus saida]
MEHLVDVKPVFSRTVTYTPRPHTFPSPVITPFISPPPQAFPKLLPVAAGQASRIQAIICGFSLTKLLSAGVAPAAAGSAGVMTHWTSR